MRVLVVSGAYYPWIGGAEVFAQALSEYMVHRGHAVDVVTGLWTDPTIQTERWHRRFENINGVNVYRCPGVNSFFLQTPTIFPFFMQQVRRLVRAHSYDLIHGIHFFGMLAGAVCKRWLGCPLLITVQGGDLADQEVSGLAGTILTPLIRWSLPNADSVHGVSSYLVQRSADFGARRTIMLPNGVDMNQFKPDNRSALRLQLGYDLNDRIIVSTSRLTPKNGLDVLIRTTARLVNNVPNLRVLIIGEGSQRPELLRLIVELGLEKVVILLGAMDREELPHYLALADIFCRPSHGEGFGISFVEAMACQLPVVGSQVGGIPDIIQDGVNGFMVRPGDVDGLTGCLDLLLRSPDLQQKIGQAGYQTVRAKFDWNIILPQFETLYQDLVQEASL